MKKINRVKKVTASNANRNMTFYIWQMDDKFFREEPDSDFAWVNKPISYDDLVVDLIEEAGSNFDVSVDDVTEEDAAQLEYVDTIGVYDIYYRTDNMTYYNQDNERNLMLRMKNRFDAFEKAEHDAKYGRMGIQQVR